MINVVSIVCFQFSVNNGHSEWLLNIWTPKSYCFIIKYHGNWSWKAIPIFKPRSYFCDKSCRVQASEFDGLSQLFFGHFGFI